MVDLHMHTVYSDGDKTVKEVLSLCEAKKLEYISITDHNTAKGYEDKKTNIDLGVGKGSINIPKEIIDEWLN